MRTRPLIVRPLAIGALLAAATVIAVVALSGGRSYTIQAEFSDAGQLVRGDLVEVGGRSVGVVSHLRLTPNGLANVVLDIKDSRWQPLHAGTIATIRAVGLSGVANRFVELAPGPPGAPPIRDGGILPTSDTNGIVDLDMLLDSLDSATRAQLQSILRDGALAVSARTAGQLSRGLVYLNPALSQTAALGRELVLDQQALERLVTTTASVASTLSSRRRDLAGAIDASAGALSDIAARRGALRDALGRAPGVLSQATAVLGRLDPALATVDPALRALQPAAPRLAKLLRQTAPLSRDAIPALAGIRALLPSARAALTPLPALATTAVPALASATTAVRNSAPILAGLRPYTPDLVAGFFNGLGGTTTGYYDANGHYARIHVEFGQGAVPGVPGAVNPSAAGYRTGLLARCPGGAAEPAPDNSNPWLPADASGLCNPQDDHR